MNITQKNSKSGSTIVLEGELTIYTVASAKAILFADYENIIDPLALDVKNVTEIDTAGIQLLLFAKKVMNNSNKRIYIKNSNTHVDSVLEGLAIVTHFTLEN